MRKLLFIPLILMLFACNKEKELPKGILSRKKMVKILIDVHIAEGKVSRSGIVQADSNIVLYKAYEKEIFKKHKVSKKAYKKSYKYYEANPQLMDEVYTAVVDSLSLRQQLHKLE